MERSIDEFISICLFLLRHKYMYTLQLFRLNQESTYKITYVKQYAVKCCNTPVTQSNMAKLFLKSVLQTWSANKAV